MQFQICNSGEVWTSVSRAEAYRIAHKRTGALAAMIRKVRKAEEQEAREYRHAERGLQAELREADRRNRSLWKRIRVQPEVRLTVAIERKSQAHRPTRTGWLAGASQLPRFPGQIFDRKGRAGIFFRVRYYGHSTKAGVGRRSTLYIWNGAHETDDGRIMFVSNVGESIEEAVAALEAVELFNREAQAGAKVLFHAIANVPYQLLEMDGGIERMFEIGRRFAEEQFGSRDLPFALALHPPSEQGDQRNWHLHLVFSTRPLVRTGDYEWDIGRTMRREIDNPEAFEEMRHLDARIQTEVAQEAGLNLTYTALSNVERGLPNAPQTHLGAARTARVRRSEKDQVNERNWETMLAGEAALLDEQLRHGQEQAAAEQALLDRVQERAAPLVAGVTNGPTLAIAAVAPHAEPIADLSSYSLAPSVDDESATAPALAIANLQSSNRRIVYVTSLGQVPLFEQGGSRATVISRSGVRTTTSSVDVPRTLGGIVADLDPVSPRMSLTPALGRERRIAALPVHAAERETAPVAALSLGSASIATGGMERAIMKPPPWAGMRPLADGMGLSLGLAVGPTRRPLDVPDEAAALADGAVDRDLGNLDRLFVARRAEVETRRELARRDRAERERSEAERARKEAEQHEREEAERQRLQVELAQLQQAEKDASNALEAMLNAIEAERNLVGFHDDACVVDEAVLKRFGVTPAAIASAKTQARLDAIADRQRREIEPIIVHASANGGHIVEDNGRWTLSPEAPGHLRRIANTWAHEPQLQRAFAEAAATYSNAQARARPTPTSESVVEPAKRLNRQQMLILAAAQREVLTDRWQQNRRSDDGNIDREASADISKKQTPSAAGFRKRLPFDPGEGR